MFVIVAVVIAISYGLINLTGPSQSFAHLASEFRSDQAFEHVKTLFELGTVDETAVGKLAAERMASIFQDLD